MILFVNNGWYFPAMSGGDVHVTEVAGRWARSHDVAVAMPVWAYRLQSRKLQGVLPIPTGGGLDRTPPASLLALCFRYVLRTATTCRLSADFVIAGSHYPYDLLPAIFIHALRHRPWAVYVFHLTFRFRTGGLRAHLIGLWERLALRLMRSAAVVFVDNASLRTDIEAAGVNGASIIQTWNASTAAPTADIEPRGTNEVIFCGRITDSKGWRDLLTVAERLKKDCPGVTLRVLGEGDRRRNLQQEAQERGLGAVLRIEGFVSDDIKWRALQRAAAFVTPSREEGWGIAVSEALDAGTEVVCYDLPVYAEVHGGRRMHVVPNFDPDLLAQTVVDVVRGVGRTATAVASVADSRLVPSRTWAEIAEHEASVVLAQLAVSEAKDVE